MLAEKKAIGVSSWWVPKRGLFDYFILTKDDVKKTLEMLFSSQEDLDNAPIRNILNPGYVPNVSKTKQDQIKLHKT